MRPDAKEKLKPVWLWFWILTVLCGVGSYLYGRNPGLIGYAVGWGSTFICVFGLYLVVSLLNQVAAESEGTDQSKAGSALTVIIFLAKIPAFAGAAVLANKVGDPGPSCFTLGLGLVYSALIWGCQVARPE